LQKPLFFGPESYFNLRWEQPDTDVLTRWHQSDFVQRRFSNCPTSSSREFRLQARLLAETAAQIAVKKFLRLALPHPERICDARVTIPGASFRGLS
jgi:hypothetical protein